MERTCSARATRRWFAERRQGPETSAGSNSHPGIAR